ncbi:MAG TPA: cupredoxin domain-containing protein [Chloroflexota bacterium]|nr:cupredoxin domain-containing protein [Chloroflexota bacterium]
MLAGVPPGCVLARLAGLPLALLLVSCGRAGAAPPATPTPVYAPKPTATFFVHLLDSRRFDPAELHGQPNQLVELVLVGAQQKHDVTSTDLNIDVDVPPGQVEVIDVHLPAKPGTYEFWSAQPGDREGGMVGHMVVAPS